MLRLVLNFVNSCKYSLIYSIYSKMLIADFLSPFKSHLNPIEMKDLQSPLKSSGKSLNPSPIENYSKR